MANEMFGAPGGIANATAEKNDQLLASMKALSTFSQLPVDAAHARYYNAEADKNLRESADLREMARIASGVKIDDPSPNETPAQAAVRLARPLESLGKIMLQKSPKLGGEMLEKSIKILQDGSVISANNALEGIRKARTDNMALQQEAGMMTWGAASPENYHQFRLGLTLKDDPKSQALFDELPEDYASGKAILEARSSQALTAKDQIDNARDDKVAKARIADLEAQTGSARAAADTNRARLRSLNQVIELRDKNGGDVSASAAENRREQRRLREEQLKLNAQKEARLQALQEAKDKSTFTPLPPRVNGKLDASKLEQGKTYYIPGRGPGIYDGSGNFELLRKPVAPTRAAPSTPTIDDTDTEDVE